MKLTITLIITLVLLIFHKKIVAKVSSSNIFLNKKYDKYAYLFKNTTASENYKITKITGKTPRFILFDNVTKNFILTGDELNLTTIRKINNKGEEIDSLEIKGHLYPSGMYFYENYCIDWVITGNKSKQKYDAIIDYDSLSKKEFEDYLNKADIVDFTHFSKYEDLKNYASKIFKGRCHLKIKDKWIVIESKKMFKELEKDYEKDYFELKHKNISKKNGNRLNALKNSIAPFYDWKKEDNMIFIQKFKKESHQRAALFSVNGQGRTGWNGTGYFQLTYNSEVLNFKSYVFKRTSIRHWFAGHAFDPDILIYFPEKEYNIDLAFIKLRAPPGSGRKNEESGIYVLKKK